MKIALIGYGKMGKLLEKTAKQNNHSIVAKIDSSSKLTTQSADKILEADICIDFSHPHAVLQNLTAIACQGKNVIVGTTGWYDQITSAQEIVRKHGIGFLYAPNFSIGITLFLQIVEEAAKLINNHPEYDVGGYEMHHSQKADFPSGTAKAIVKSLIENIERKTNPVYDLKNRKLLPHELHFGSVRYGSIPGTHTVLFDSPTDTITITHEARNRDGFAQGAIKAAEWLIGKKGFYTLEDMFK